MSLNPVGTNERASALSGKTDHKLVDRLRQICNSNESALTAATRYHQNFELSLAECKDGVSREKLLSDWLEHRVGILHRTVRDLRRICEKADSDIS